MNLANKGQGCTVLPITVSQQQGYQLIVNTSHMDLLFSPSVLYHPPPTVSPPYYESTMSEAMMPEAMMPISPAFCLSSANQFFCLLKSLMRYSPYVDSVYTRLQQELLQNNGYNPQLHRHHQWYPLAYRQPSFHYIG